MSRMGDLEIEITEALWNILPDYPNDTLGAVFDVSDQLGVHCGLVLDVMSCLAQSSNPEES